MEITPELMDEIERKARAATPGPWVNMPDGSFWGEIRSTERFEEIANMPKSDDRTPDFEHIAACNPETVLALVALARRAMEPACGALDHNTRAAALEEAAQIAERFNDNDEFDTITRLIAAAIRAAKGAK